MSSASQASTIAGECNCGAVKITVPLPIQPLCVCHCSDCRKQTGTIAAYNFTVPKEKMQIQGEVKEYIKKGDSGGQVYRYFCGTCGSPVYDRDEVDPDDRFIKSGIFPLGSLPAPNRELYVKNMEHWERPYPETSRKQEMFQ